MNIVHRTLSLALALAACCAALPGCASRDDTSRNLELGGDMTMPLGVNINQFVRRQPPAIYVKPLQRPSSRPTALFVPLRMVQQMNQPTAFTDQVSRQIWSIWLSQGTFQQLEYEPAAGPYHPKRAIALARQRGMPYVVGGYINHYIDGGDGGESAVSLALEIYDVKSGLLLWSLAQGGTMQPRQSHDFYLFKVKERFHGDPAGLIVRSLAWDMGRELMGWVSPAAGRAMKKSASPLGGSLGGSAF